VAEEKKGGLAAMQFGRMKRRRSDLRRQLDRTIFIAAMPIRDSRSMMNVIVSSAFL